MNITINNQSVLLEQELPLLEVLNSYYDKPLQGVAVAINGSVVPKSAWEQTIIKANDSILVITATAGG